MSKNTFTTKRRLAYAVYNSLKRIPPREYPSTEEIKIVLEDILPELKEHVIEYIEVVRKATAINSRMEEFGRKKVEKMVADLNDKWKVYNKEHGLDDVKVDLDKDAIKTLTDQFNRDDAKGQPPMWGRSWFGNIEEFQVFADNLEGKKSKINLEEDDDIVVDDLEDSKEEEEEEEEEVEEKKEEKA